MDKERKYVSDAAAEAITAKGGSIYEGWAGRYGVVVLTVAEHDELLALRAEVEAAEWRELMEQAF